MRPGDEPNACPASMTSRSTPRIPSSVNRTPGAMAKAIVATIPGTTPIPNRMIAGIRYTKAGIVCRKSSTGLMMEETVFDHAAQMPIGMLITTATKAATSVSARVSIAFPHWLRPAISTSPTAAPAPKAQPLAYTDRPTRTSNPERWRRESKVEGVVEPTEDRSNDIEEPAEVHGDEIDNGVDPVADRDSEAAQLNSPSAVSRTPLGCWSVARSVSVMTSTGIAVSYTH